MRVVFTPHGWDDYTHWHTADRTMIKRTNRLIDAACREPFTGIGKPEQGACEGVSGADASTRNTAWSTSSTATTW